MEEKDVQEATATPAQEAPTTPAQEPAPAEKGGVANAIMSVVSGIMLPCMSALIGCGLVSALTTILRLTGIVAEGTGTYQVLYGIGQTCLYFFPIIVGSSTAKYFQMDDHIGAIIGAALIYPTFTAAADAGEVTTFLGFIPLSWTNYSSTVLPAIVAVWFGSVVYKFLGRHTPEVLKLAIQNFGTILITVPLALIVIGPATNMVGSALSQAVLFVYNLSPVVCGALLGAVWQVVLIPLGLHWAFVAVAMNNFVTLGYDPLLGLVCAGVTMTGTLLAVGLKAKNAKTKSLAFSTAITNFCGISEPGLFGVVLLHKQTIAATAIAYGATGVIAAIFGVALHSMGASGIFAIPNYINPSGDMSSLIGAVICQLAGIAISFILTMIIPFDPDEGMEEEVQPDAQPAE